GENTLVVLEEIRAYRQGCLFEITAATRRGDQPEESWIGAGRNPVGLSWPARPDEALPDVLLRFGVQYADGTKATTTARERWKPYEDMPDPADPPVLTSVGGRGSTAVKDLVEVARPLWLWPAPPAQMFDLAVEWPAAGIDLTRYPVDGTRIAEAAQYSLPFSLATALLRGEIAPAQLTGTALHDPQVLRLAACTRLFEDPVHTGAFPTHRLATVTLTCGAGRTLTSPTTTAPGGPDQPMGDIELRAKFATYARPVLDPRHAVALAALIDTLDTADSARPLLDAVLRAPSLP
ncbi:MAG: hypothetical protein ACRDRL_27205, partial [Sciscionella sp.]